MTDYQLRVISEKEELEEKLLKLNSFIDLDKFKSLPFEDQGLLLRQCIVMEEYKRILQERIDRFGE